MPRTYDDLITEARTRFVRAKSYWSSVAMDFRADVRYVSGNPVDQWPIEVYTERTNHDLPALVFDRCNPRVQAIVNKARRDRPQPKVIQGDDGRSEVAEALEGKVRHILYASQADIPFDNAVMYAAAGGIGAYRLKMEYVSRKPGRGGDPFRQEPRVKWIRDPLSALFPDPASQEPDFSDARWWFVREQFPRETIKDKFGVEAMDFDEEDSQWGDSEDAVWLAEYWCVEESQKRYVQLHNGMHGYEDEFEKLKPEHIANERYDSDRKIVCHLIDGEKEIEATPWPGEWIPIFLVTGRQMFSEGKCRFISAIRYSRDPQSFMNASISELAIALGGANMNQWTGPVGSFKDGKWNSNRRELYREWTPQYGENGEPLPPPVRDNWAPPIQHLVQALAVSNDAVQGSMGYTDMIRKPSQADLSGAAVSRREEQADASNTHYEDNLIASQWHLGRCLVDLIIKVTDTPQMMISRGEDGSQKTIPIAVPDDNGNPQFVPGKAPEQHIRFDEGDYGVAISTGQSYETQMKEEGDRLLELYTANPVLALQMYGDILFEKLGYRDLAERSKMGLAPQIQQSLQANQQGLPPAAAQQLAAMQGQMAQLKQALQQAVQMLQSKAVEGKAKLDVEKLKAIKDVMVQSMKERHDSAGQMLEGHLGAIQHITQLMHENQQSQFTAAAGAAQQAAQPQPQPQQGAVQ